MSDLRAADAPAVTKNVGDDRTDETDENYAFGNDAAIWICRHAGDYFPHPECPFDCDCKPVRYIRAATNQTQEAVADPKKDPGPVDPVLFSLCVERVARSMVDDRATPLDRPLTVVVTPKAFAKYTVDLIAPLLLEAGAKQERERIKARVERLQPNREPNFVVNASPEAKANFKGLDDMWRAVLASITEEGKGE